MELRRTWKAPSVLDVSRPRSVALTRSGKALVGLAVGLGTTALALVLGLGLAAHRQADEAWLLRDQGAVAAGTVTRLWRARDKQKQPWMEYRFVLEGGTYVRTVKVPYSVWRNLTAGEPVRVRYAHSRPEINHPVGWAGAAIPFWAPYLAGFALAGLAVLPLLPLRQQRRLVEEGRHAPGLVISHGKLERDQNGRQLGRKYGYQFPLLSGAVADGKAGPVKNPPEIGSAIVVLYDPEKPRNNAPYPLKLVRPVSPDEG
jgi:hypothetical protein